MNTLYVRGGKRYWVRRCTGFAKNVLIEVSHYQDRDMKRPQYKCKTWLKRAAWLGGDPLR